MHRIERIFAALMKGIMQIGQTHCVYVIEAKDYDAFAPQARHDDRNVARQRP
jgi:hypothetical protein